MGQGVAYESEAARAVSLNWRPVAQACIDVATARRERTTFELRMVARALMDERDELPSEVARAMGWQSELDAESGEEDTGADQDWTFARLESCSADQLARFTVLLAIAYSPIAWGPNSVPEKLSIAAHFGVDPENPSQSVEAGCAGENQTDEPADAGVARDPNTSDMFPEGAPA